MERTLWYSAYSTCVNTIPFKASFPPPHTEKNLSIKMAQTFCGINGIHTPNLIKLNFHEYVLLIFFFNNHLIKAILNVNSKSGLQMYVEIQNWKWRSKYLRILSFFLIKQMHSWNWDCVYWDYSSKTSERHFPCVGKCLNQNWCTSVAQY